MRAGLTAEGTLESLMRQQVASIKEQYSCWQDPEALCKELNIRVAYGKLGPSREGAAFADAILLDPTAGVSARRQFTFYHEIAHHLLHNHAELYSIIHDQYETEELFDAIRERLCNVGAAEFLLPREHVREVYEEHGFSIALVSALSQSGRVSRVAACAQLAFCAPHPCIALVCRVVPAQQSLSSILLHADVRSEGESEVLITCAFRSAHTKYSCTGGTPLPAAHLLTSMMRAPQGECVRATAPIPFRSRRRWDVECECVRLGEQVFAFFHLEEPPVSTQGQLRLW